MSEPTAAEIEAAARIIADLPELVDDVDHENAASDVLTAVLPLVEARLRAEVERLRAAVRQAFDAVDWDSDGYNPGVARAILRDALTPDAD